MKNRMLLAVLALLGIGLGYLWTSRGDQAAAARSITMPENPHIVYLSPPDAVHGQLTPQTIRDRGGLVWQSWAEVRAAAQQRPLDGLLVEEQKFSELTEADHLWLREQIEEGVVVVGVGIDIEPFAAALGLPSMRRSTEAPIPIGDDGYYMLAAFVLGTPKDVAAMREADWLAHAILENPVKLNAGTMNAGVGSGRGKLVTKQDINNLFSELMSWIDYFYTNRADFLSSHSTK